MMTKEEERAVLLKIEKALSAAEPGGYVARAFEGCVALAHENIDYDFGVSPMDWKRKLDTSEKELKEINEDYNEYRKLAERQKAQLHEEYKDLKSRYDKDYEVASEILRKKIELETKVESLESEVIRLKARLFDMMEGDKK